MTMLMLCGDSLVSYFSERVNASGILTFYLTLFGDWRQLLTPA